MKKGSPSKTLFIGHRGASWNAPENTMSAINLAWKRGADAVEIDIQLTKDNTIVVFHDDDTSRFTGEKRTISEYNFEELQKIDVGSFKGPQWSNERIPVINEVLDSVPDGKTLVIELKSGTDLIPKLKNILTVYFDLLPNIVFISFNRDAVQTIKKVYPENLVLRVYEPEWDSVKKKWLPDRYTMIKETKDDGLDGLDVCVDPKIDSDFIQIIKQNKLKLVVWTVNDIEQAGFFCQSGIYGITTDRPVWLRDNICNRVLD